MFSGSMKYMSISKGREVPYTFFKTYKAGGLRSEDFSHLHEAFASVMIGDILTLENVFCILTSTYEMGKIPILSPSIPSAQFSSTLRITVRISS